MPLDGSFSEILKDILRRRAEGDAAAEKEEDLEDLEVDADADVKVGVGEGRSFDGLASLGLSPFSLSLPRLKRVLSLILGFVRVETPLLLGL